MNLAPQSLLLKPNSVVLLKVPHLSSKEFDFPATGLKSPHFRRTLNWKCRSYPGEKARDPNGSEDLKNSLSGIVGKQVEELLSREENKGLLDGLERASMKVEMAKRELAEIERQELEAKMMQDYVNQLETRASEIAECQREIFAARTMVEEAEHSLSRSENMIAERTTENEEMIDTDRDRLESVKAAAVAATIGTFAELPISLSQVPSIEQLILPLVIAAISCALFGVTFRYAVRRDLDNVQLKIGTAAAFGFVKGLGMLSGGPVLELSSESLVWHAIDGAILVSQSLLIFAFASVALDFCFKLGFLSPFPTSQK